MRGGNLEEAGISSLLKKDGYLSETVLYVSGRYPKEAGKGGEEDCPLPQDRIPKKGKGSTSPTDVAATGGQIPQKDGEWELVEKNIK